MKRSLSQQAFHVKMSNPDSKTKNQGKDSGVTQLLFANHKEEVKREEVKREEGSESTPRSLEQV